MAVPGIRRYQSGMVLALALLLGVGGLGSMGAALALQKHPIIKADSGSQQASVSAVRPLEPSRPRTITIPSVGISSEVSQVGKEADGSMATPSGDDYDKAAWYHHSPTPGQSGASVILGHVDSYKTGPSVFWRLGEVKPNDTIQVEREDGTTARFTVTSVKSYDRDAFPTETVYTSANNDPELRLITCGGEFDTEAGDYTRNTVVSARLEA